MVSTRRKALLAVAASAVVANLVLFIFSQEPERVQFVLEPLNANGTLGGDRVVRPLPSFNGKAWSAGGQPVNRLADFLLDTYKWDAPHSSGKIMLITLPDNAGSEAFRLSVSSLAEEGICQVAVFQSGAPVSAQGLATAVRVRRYLDASGQPHKCIDRVNGET